MNTDQKRTIIENSKFKCEKCGFYSPLGNDLALVKDRVLCSICKTFAPEDEQLSKYIQEKIKWSELETFRKFNINRASHSPHKLGMLNKAKEGKLVARPPFGYKVVKGSLIPDEEDKENVRLIFKEFSEGRSLNQLSKQYGLSVNGVKKILKNFAYLGKMKFNGQINNAIHQPIIAAELFNKAQQRFEELRRQRVKR